MALRFSCDGCGTLIERPSHVGVVIQRDYCASCAKEATQFLGRLARVRHEAQEMYQEALEKEVANSVLQFLPDVLR